MWTPEQVVELEARLARFPRYAASSGRVIVSEVPSGLSGDRADDWLLAQASDSLSEELTQRVVDVLTNDAAGAVRDAPIVEFDWNVEGHNAISTYKSEVLDEIGAVAAPEWMATYPEHIVRIWRTAASYFGAAWARAIERGAVMTGADLRRPEHYKLMLSFCSVMSLKVPEWVRSKWGVDPTWLGGLNVLWGRTLTPSEGIDKSGNQFSIGRALSVATSTALPSIPLGVYAAAYRAVVDSYSIARRSELDLRTWLSNPLNYTTTGVSRLKIVLPDGTKVRTTKGGISLSLSVDEMYDAVFSRDAKIQCFASAKMDRGATRVIFAVSWESFVLLLWRTQTAGFGTGIGSAVGVSSVNVVSQLDDMRNSGAMLNSDDASRFDFMIKSELMRLYNEAEGAAAERRCVEPLRDEMRRVNHQLAHMFANVEFYVPIDGVADLKVLGPGPTGFVRVEVDMLPSGVFITSKMGTATSRTWREAAAVKTSAGPKAGDPRAMGDDTADTCADGATNDRTLRYMRDIGVQISKTKSLYAYNSLVFLMTLCYDGIFTRFPARMFGALTEIDPQVSMETMGVDQLVAYVGVFEELLARSRVASGAEVNVGFAFALLRRICSNWRVPPRVVETVQALGGLGVGSMTTTKWHRPPVLAIQRANPELRPIARAPGVRFADAVAVGIELSPIERSALDAACADWLSLQAVSHSYDHEKHTQIKEAEHEFVWRGSTLHESMPVLLSRSLEAASLTLQGIMSSARPWEFASRTHGRNIAKNDRDPQFGTFVYDAIRNAMMLSAREAEALWVRCMPVSAMLTERMRKDMRFAVFEALFVETPGPGTSMVFPVGQASREVISRVMAEAVRRVVAGGSRPQLRQLRVSDVQSWAAITGLELRRAWVTGMPNAYSV